MNPELEIPRGIPDGTEYAPERPFPCSECGTTLTITDAAYKCLMGAKEVGKGWTCWNCHKAHYPYTVNATAHLEDLENA
jgi:hypothetical protein